MLIFSGRAPAPARSRLARPTSAPAGTVGFASPTSAILVGGSTGAPGALAIMLRHLSRWRIDAPIFVAIHVPGEFSQSLANLLQRESNRPVVVTGEPREPMARTIYLPASGRHLVLTRRGDRSIVTGQKARAEYTPSVDALFTSAATALGHRALAVVLTGMGVDGLAGARAITTAGGVVFAQDETSSAVTSMPLAVVSAGLATTIGPPDLLAAQIAGRFGSAHAK